MSEQTLETAALKEQPPTSPGFDTTTLDLSVIALFRSFYDHESTLLDDAQRLWEWFGLLAPDISYRVPVRVSRERRSRRGEFSESGYHMQEDLESLRLRIQRLDTEHAWAEEPPSRLRRVVSGIEVLERRASDEYLVASSFLLFRGRDRLDADLLAGQRHDLLRVVDKRILLAGRTVYLEHTVLPTANLGVFL